MSRAVDASSMRSRLWLIYAAAGLLAGVAYFYLGSEVGQAAVYSVVGLRSVAAVVGGTFINFSGRLQAMSWWLVACGLLMFAVGDIIWDLYESFLEREVPFPSYADILYLAGYPLLVAGLALLLLRGRRSDGWGHLIDALIIATGIGLLYWVLLIGPCFADAGLSSAERLVSAAYPLMDLVLLAVVVRLMMGLGVRTSASYRFLLAGVSCC